VKIFYILYAIPLLGFLKGEFQGRPCKSTTGERDAGGFTGILPETIPYFFLGG
jgi:hypothetical protein